MSTYQCSVCFYTCDLKLEVIEKFQANKTVRLVVFYTGKVTQKSVPFAHGNFQKLLPEFLVEWKAPTKSFNEQKHGYARAF